MLKQVFLSWVLRVLDTLLVFSGTHPNSVITLPAQALPLPPEHSTLTDLVRRVSATLPHKNVAPVNDKACVEYLCKGIIINH